MLYLHVYGVWRMDRLEQPRSIEERDDVKERLTRRRLELPAAGV